MDLKFRFHNISLLGSKIWNVVPPKIKDSETEIFPKKWKPDGYPYSFCKSFTVNVGFNIDLT